MELKKFIPSMFPPASEMPFSHGLGWIRELNSCLKSPIHKMSGLKIRPLIKYDKRLELIKKIIDLALHVSKQGRETGEITALCHLCLRHLARGGKLKPCHVRELTDFLELKAGFLESSQGARALLETLHMAHFIEIVTKPRRPPYASKPPLGRRTIAL